MVSEDCNCTPPRGHVKAKRVAGGFGAGVSWSAHEGDTVMVPRSVVENRPDDWLVLTDPEQPTGSAESHDTSLDDLEGLTVPELREMAADAGVSLPGKARKSDIVQALTNAPAR